MAVEFISWIVSAFRLRYLNNYWTSSNKFCRRFEHPAWTRIIIE
jgi:hypothetical protein